MASAQVSQAALKIFTQVAHVFYTPSHGYFLSASCAHGIFYLGCSNYVSFYTQIFGRAVKPILEGCMRAAGYTAVLCCLGTSARLPQEQLSSN